MKRYVLSITGASGAVFGIRLLEYLASGSEVHLVISSGSFPIIKHETGLDWSGDNEAAVERTIRAFAGSDHVLYHHEYDLAAPVSSGSFITDGMFVVPCSMKTLSGIANGYANNLTERAADVAIKEGRPLLISPREMPLSALHLENMLKLARLGVKIAPPIPGFYHRPENVRDIVDFVVGKILDSFGIDHDLFRRWGG